MNMDWLVSQEFLKRHPLEASRVLQDLTPEEIRACLEQADAGTANTLLQFVGPRIASKCLKAWTEERVARLLEELPITSLPRMLRLMTDEEQERMIALAPRSAARILRSALRYPEDTAAGWAELERHYFTEDLLMSQVWKLVRRQSDPIGPYVYVVDREGVLVGVASLGDVLAARPRAALASVMCRPVERISAYDRRAVVVRHPAWQRFPTLPIVDEEGVLLGRIRYSTLRHLEQGLPSHGASDAWRVFALSLAELYWVSSTQLVRSVSGAWTSSLAPARQLEASDDA